MKTDTSKSVRSIQKRLLIIILRGFVITVSLVLLFTLITTALVLANPSRSNPLSRLPLISRLETYYLARGNWDGVTHIFTDSKDFETLQWRESTLLDANNRVIVEFGQEASPGAVYIPHSRENMAPIIVRGVTVGQLVLGPHGIPIERRYAFGFLQPVAFVAIVLSIFAIAIGFLLMRRLVNPLAEVIAAAQQVASGRLETRVSPQGPDDLRALSDSFNQMAAALERDERERRDMLADIAHELRTPLTVLRGRLEGILDGVYTADESHITPALESTYLLERLVEDLRLLTLAETRQLQFEKKTMDAAHLTRRILEIFSAESHERGVTINLECEKNEHPVFADPQRTEQVIGNLVSNALRFAPDGGQVKISLSTVAGGTQITVSDNGPGISDEDLPYIFNRFWRKEKSRARVSGGTGLGLAITKQLVEAQDGHITASKSPEGGLRVSVVLPAKPENPERHLSAIPNPKQTN